LEISKKTGNKALIQVKENQGYLLFDCETNAKGKKENDLHIQKDKKHHNRREIRITKTFHNPDFIFRGKWGDLIGMIVQVIRNIDRFDSKAKSWKKSVEISHYVSTHILPAETVARVIRDHWRIENRNHYVRDVSMGEDHSRIRKNAGIFVRLRSLALNIMRYNGVQNVACEIYKNSLSFENLEKYKGLID